MYTMFFINRRGSVIFIVENVTAQRRKDLLSDPHWVTAE